MNTGDPVQITRGPWTGFRGVITHMFAGGWVSVFLAERTRTFATDELVNLNTAREHRVVTTIDFGDIHRHRCLDCGATRSGTHPPQPPCTGAPE